MKKPSKFRKFVSFPFSLLGRLLAVLAVPFIFIAALANGKTCEEIKEDASAVAESIKSFKKQKQAGNVELTNIQRLAKSILNYQLQIDELTAILSKDKPDSMCWYEWNLLRQQQRLLKDYIAMLEARLNIAVEKE